MIGIILCTYNGERYLAQQLDSILSQTYKDFVIYVHDDGSTDRTLDIVEKYRDKHKGKIVLMDDPIKHRGAGPSFMWSLQNVEAQYDMFCDQDDGWLHFKIEHTLSRMLEVEKQKPGVAVLIHTDLKLTDGRLNVTHSSFWKYQNFKVDVSKKPQYIGFGNIVTGCTMIINRKAKELAAAYEGKMLHDYWLALQVAKHGVVDNLKEQTMLYRQHGDNEAGAGCQYNKHRVGYKNFINGLHEEYARFHDVCSKGYLSWFYFRVLYFIHRHLL